MNRNEFIKLVSKEWREAPHIPNDFDYNEFIRQTSRQMDNIIDRGFSVAPFRGEGQPYKSSVEMFDDMDSKLLYVYRGGDVFAPGHELAALSYFNGLSWNEVFRAVHDYFGHYLTRSPFETWEGEVSAYEAHKLMYRGRALGPLYAETIGQLCVYFDTGDFPPEQKAVKIPVRDVPKVRGGDCLYVL
jgi:hypothetical protein